MSEVVFLSCTIDVVLPFDSATDVIMQNCSLKCYNDCFVQTISLQLVLCVVQLETHLSLLSENDFLLNTHINAGSGPLFGQLIAG